MTIPKNAARTPGKPFASAHAGTDKLASARLRQAVPKLDVRSEWFADGEPLPARASADGEGEPPPLEWSEPPPRTREFALVCEDPDAPRTEPFVHWLVYSIPGNARALDGAGVARARQGRNGAGGCDFTPAAPPPGHGVHHYHFELFALDEPLGLDTGADKAELVDAMDGHVLAYGELVGTFTR
ncbi:MAG TPA: YbhB/YbcL family Raf kinase inhibitor-like protein [Polyangiaceae bacterium]|nr:YbhB/YbcL family Raf kinase inhibitor-like protein [Polyangiaceae bacterium]